MNTDEAKQVARDYFDGDPGLSIEAGFEIVGVSRYDFKEWEVECRIFSTTFSKMEKYVVIIHDDVATCARRSE
jgi:hypothetical protein